MNGDDIRKVIVIGAGQMGSGIAQVTAAAGVNVVLHDVREAAVEKGLAAIEKNLSRDVVKGRKTKEEMQAILQRIEPTTSLSAARDVQLVIEAATEDKETKTRIFREVDALAPPDAILATNTSSIPITELAAVTGRPERFIGMHFFNPVPVMNLVEIIRGLATADETYAAIETLTRKIGKVPVGVNDFPGFVSNRILLPMINEAVYCVYEGVAAPEAVDEVMKLGMNHPMGPLRLADLIGLDTCLAVLEVLHEGLGDPKYRPCPLLRKYVSAGWLGRKTGRGFYVYEEEKER